MLVRTGLAFLLLCVGLVAQPNQASAILVCRPDIAALVDVPVYAEIGGGQVVRHVTVKQSHRLQAQSWPWVAARDFTSRDVVMVFNYHWYKVLDATSEPIGYLHPADVKLRCHGGF